MGICGLEEAKEILENVMADEVIGIYCDEIQKTTECAKNCEKEDCFLQQAIDTVISELDRLQKENEILSKTNADLSFLVYELQQKIDDSISKDVINLQQMT